jgi:hypothetical protein
MPRTLKKGAPMLRRRLFGLVFSGAALLSLIIVPIASAHLTWC